MGGGEEFLPQQLIETVIRVVSERRSAKLFVKDCAQIIQRLKHFVPLLEKVRDMKTSFPGQAFLGLVTAIQRAKQLVHFCQTGSKLYMIMKKELMSKEFQDTILQLVKTLETLPLDEVDASNDLRELVKFSILQLQRSKPFENELENEMYEDFNLILTTPAGGTEDLMRLGEGLNLRFAYEYKKEGRALEKLRAAHGVADVQYVYQKLKAVALPETERAAAVDMPIETPDSSVVIAVPNDFRCPISLEIMKDPVIIATGQTYERSYIQKWFAAGHRTCPKTQQVLPHFVLTPNYALRSLIAQWSESHGVELTTGASRDAKPVYRADGSLVNRGKVDLLIKSLSSGIPNLQKAAAEEIRQLTKDSSQDRACIAEAGAIPFLVTLLDSKDLVIQEHAVTALLNLSIYDKNKSMIVSLGAVDPIVEVLKSGSTEARRNAAATLFSLSAVDQNKVLIGASEAIPALEKLLRETSRASKKDAATALYNLCLYHANKARAVRAGVVPELMKLVVDPSMDLVEESLAILALVTSHVEGIVAVGQNGGAVPVLVELIMSGSERCKENAMRILQGLNEYHFCHFTAAQQLEVSEALKDIVKSGSDRTRKKASSLLEQVCSS